MEILGHVLVVIGIGIVVCAAWVWLVDWVKKGD